MNSTQPRRILLGVTGGIAAYKSPDLVRRLGERGAQVQVVMTDGAREFVTPLTFQAVSGRAVRSSLWDSAAEAAMGHIELARWADEIVIAPATANFLAKLAHGVADDLLSTLCLASAAPISVAPAMNHLMWMNAATQTNAEILRQRGIHVLGPGVGDQACGETGAGRMLEPIEIADRVMGLRSSAGKLSGLNVVVTAGPTRERIDPVRFVSNRSSGKMGYAVAKAVADAGAQVTLISGPVNLCAPRGLERVNVETAEQMLAAVSDRLDKAHIFIAAAAVSDYRAAQVACEKIKKTAEALTLSLTRTPDILATVGALPQHPFLVGFAAETTDVERHALLKLESKHLDMIAANKVGDGLAFDKDDNALTVLWRGGRREFALTSKAELAQQLVELIAERYHAKCMQVSSTASARSASVAG